MAWHRHHHHPAINMRVTHNYLIALSAEQLFSTREIVSEDKRQQQAEQRLDKRRMKDREMLRSTCRFLAFNADENERIGPACITLLAIFNRVIFNLHCPHCWPPICKSTLLSAICWLEPIIEPDSDASCRREWCSSSVMHTSDRAHSKLPKQFFSLSSCSSHSLDSAHHRKSVCTHQRGTLIEVVIANWWANICVARTKMSAARAIANRCSSRQASSKR